MPPLSAVKIRPIILALLALLAASALRAAELTVFAAASLSDALREIAVGYEAKSGDKLRFNFGASSLLARQIREGAPADVFFSADEPKMDDLAAAGLILAETRRSVLSNTLVIVVVSEAGADIARPADLTRDAVRRLALAETSTVPAGIYAREYLQGVGLWDAVAPKVVPLENVRAAMAAVESGNAEAGIVYKTDALVSKKVRIACEVPLGEGPRISYPLAVVRNTRHGAEARRFVAHLQSPDALAVFRRFGFLAAP
jgi:molybdate transport system substrate-binding protein